MTNTALKIPCPCGSKQHFDSCCLTVINQPVLADKPELLMRARYSAYCMGGFGQFLLDSWHETKRQGLTVEDLDTRGYAWCRLRILQHDKDATNSDHGWVTFLAYFNNDGQLDVMHERSEFVREAGQWYYLQGQQFATAIPSRKSPCLCGSDKPFKRCCGAQ